MLGASMKGHQKQISPAKKLMPSKTKDKHEENESEEHEGDNGLQMLQDQTGMEITLMPEQQKQAGAKRKQLLLTVLCDGKKIWREASSSSSNSIDHCHYWKFRDEVE